MPELPLKIGMALPIRTRFPHESIYKICYLSIRFAMLRILSTLAHLLCTSKHIINRNVYIALSFQEFSMSICDVMCVRYGVYDAMRSNGLCEWCR